MRFDNQGHLICKPSEIYELAVKNPQRLLNEFLMGGTPEVFKKRSRYCDFLEAVSDRTGVHEKNLYVRGSCQIGFSIAPKADKVWQKYGEKSDLDLVIVDAVYFHRCEEELRQWESRNPVPSPQDTRASSAAARRALDRRFNCLRDKGLPSVVCVHHRDVLAKVTQSAHCGHVRGVSAFMYPDWHSAQKRYEFDLQQLIEGVNDKWLPPPPDHPLPRLS